jgi:pimeloyl-ACP methyl ester carboxylesterase
VKLAKSFAFLMALCLFCPVNAEARTPESFAPCPDATLTPVLARTVCATVAVPLEYRRPDAGTIDLFVRKFPAAGVRKGQIWLVAGGPGESGASFYPLIEIFRAAAPGYDLIVPDHRGTGYSARLCPDEEAVASDGGTALEGAEWGTCFAVLNAKAERTKAFSISNAAFDLNMLIDRFSKGGRTYLYGVSYGTQLVVRVLAIAAPKRLKGVILDSLVPPDTSEIWDLSHRSAVVDGVGRKILAECDANSECRAPLGTSTEAAMQMLINDPKTATLVGANPKYLFGSLLDDPATRAQIPSIIVGLVRQDITPLRQAKSSFASYATALSSYPQAQPSIPLTSLISRSENNARPELNADQVAEEAKSYLFASPLPGLLLQAGIPVYSRDAGFGALPNRMPPTLVLQGDLDPKTPYEGANAHIALLKPSGHIGLMTVTGGPHFLLLTAPACFTAAMRQFIAKGLPPSRTCAVDSSAG